MNELIDFDTLLDDFQDIQDIWKDIDFLDMLDITSNESMINQLQNESNKSNINDDSSTDISFNNTIDDQSIDQSVDKPSDNQLDNQSDESIDKPVDKHMKFDDDLPDINESNIKSITILLTEAINCGDFNKISHIAKKYFATNCIVKTPMIKESLNNNKFVYFLFESLLTTFPDFILINKKNKLIKSSNDLTILSSKVYFSGTNSYTYNYYNYLFKPHECNLVDEIIKYKKLNNEEEKTLRSLEVVLKSNGRRFLIWGSGTLNLVYNKELNQIIEFDFDIRISSFKQCPY